MKCARLALSAAVLLAAWGCASPRVEVVQSSSPNSLAEHVSAVDRGYHQIAEVQVQSLDDGRFTFAISLSDADLGVARSVDGFRVMTEEGLTIADVRFPDAGRDVPVEVRVSDPIKRVMIQPRDAVDGFGARAVAVDLPGR